MLREKEIINFLKHQFPTPGGIGDDAAILPFSNVQKYVITKDLLVENVHFRLSYGDAASLAYKALQVNISDVAAMGALPKYAFLGLAAPKHREDYLRAFLDAFVKHCQLHRILLLGGDTSGSSQHLFLSVTLIGVASPSRIKRRHLANVGDLICVAGRLGYAHLGLQALEQGRPGLETFKEAFLNPAAKQSEGVWLGKQHAVTAMMDLSDGLFLDLSKLCEASQVAADVHLDQWVPPQEFTEACHHLRLDPTEVMLAGGEDYGLLFTAKKEHFHSLESRFREKFQYPLLCIGMIGPEREGLLQLFRHGRPVEIRIRPFSHFGEL